MQIKPLILKSVGFASFIGGLIILAFTLSFVRIVTQLDMSSLKNYAPNAGHTYEDLYDLTRHIGSQRNYLAMLFFISISIACITLGVVLWMWSRDIKRLQKNVACNELSK
jgi:hypothetical protein